jgi:hypothetical protein
LMLSLLQPSMLSQGICGLLQLDDQPVPIHR